MSWGPSCRTRPRLKLVDAARVAVVAWFVFYLFHFLYTGVYAAAGYVMAAPT